MGREPMKQWQATQNITTGTGRKKLRTANGKKQKRNRLAKQNGHQVNWSWKNYFAAFMPQVAANQLQKNAYKQPGKTSRYNRRLSCTQQ